MKSAGVLALVALTIGGSSLEGQAQLTGRVVNDSSRAPIAGAELVVLGTTLRTQTGTDGRFTLAGIPMGVGHTVIRKVGFRPVQIRTLIFAESDTLEVEIGLRPSVVELEPIVVTAAAVPPGMDAFAERRFGGQGTFIDWTVLRESEHRRVSDLLRSVHGVELVMDRGSRTIAMSNRGRCPMAIWQDGLPVYRPGTLTPLFDIDLIPVSQLEAIEIYRGPAETPAEMGGTGATCGTIVLWTRRR